jgi:hypothetical protein
MKCPKCGSPTNSVFVSVLGGEVRGCRVRIAPDLEGNAVWVAGCLGNDALKGGFAHQKDYLGKNIILDKNTGKKLTWEEANKED